MAHFRDFVNPLPEVFFFVKGIPRQEIKNGRKVITTPITDEDIKGLRASESFYLSGDVMTGRDEVHERVVTEEMDFPADIKGNALFHAGPIVKEGASGRYELVSIGPTTSMRMEKLEKDKFGKLQ